MATFPTSIPTYAGFTSSHTLSADNHAAQHNSEQGDIVAIATKLGTGSATPASGLLLRGTGTGTSSWAQAALSTDVTGILPTVNGGTGNTTGTATTNANLTGPITSAGNATAIASQTGTGTKFVVDTSPTIVTPTIASFTNANHNHSNAAGGGSIGTSAITTSMFKPSLINFTQASGTNFTTTSATYVDITGATTSYTAGASNETLLIWIAVMAETTGSDNANVTLNAGSDLAPALYFTSTIASRQAQMYIVNVAANSTTTLKLRAKIDSGTLTVNLSDANFVPTITGFAVSNV